MNYLSSNIYLLEFMQLALLIGGFVFSTNYLFPRSIKNFRKWKDEKDYKRLIVGIEQLTGGILILILLIIRMI